MSELPDSRLLKDSSRDFWMTLVWRVGAIGIASTYLFDMTVRDSIPVIAVLFYGTPPIVLAVGSLIWLGIARWFIRASNLSFDRILGRILLLLALVCSVHWGIENFPLRKPSTIPAGAVKILLWNVSHLMQADWESIALVLQKENPDIVVLAEASRDVTANVRLWHHRLDGYKSSTLRGGLVVLYRDDLKNTVEGSLGNGRAIGYYRRMSVSVRGLNFDLLLADLKSNPLASRKKQLSDLLDNIQSQQSTPSLIVGDLNTPPTSVWFDAWRNTNGLKRAWETSGTGYQPTWPMPLPVLTLDHIWGNKPIQFHHCQTGWSLCSDHRYVTAHFTID